MRLIIKLAILTILTVGCSSEDKEVSQSNLKPVEATVAGPFPKTVSGTVEHWEDAGDGKGTSMIFLKEYKGTMIILAAEDKAPDVIEQAGTKVTFEVNTLSKEKCGGSDMQCLSAK